MKTKITGKVKAVLIGDQASSFITRRVSVAKVGFTGFTGDHHAGQTLLSGGRTPYYPRGTEIRNYRQVSILSQEEMDQTGDALGISGLQPEWYGANLMLEGIESLTRLPPSTRLFFSGGAVLVVDGDNSPCDSVAKIIQEKFPNTTVRSDFVQKAKGRRGIVAWVEKPGLISENDDVEALIPEHHPYP